MTTTVTRALAVMTLLALFVLHRHAPPDLSSPKATVHTFVDALMAKDSPTLVACVSGAKDARSLARLLQDNAKPLHYDIKDLIVEMNGDGAKVAVETEVLNNGGDGVQKVLLVDLLSLKKEGEVWRIVPDADILKGIVAGDSAQTKRLEERSLKVMAAVIGDSEISARAIVLAQEKEGASTCLSNGKHLALALIQYQQDYDEVLPPAKANYSEVVLPYVRDKKAFTCPQDPPGTVSYSLNKNLAGVTNAQIVAVTSTIMLYEGRDMKPDFRHNGKAMIAFADGHVRMCTPDMMHLFSWTPDGKIGAAPDAPPDSPQPPTAPSSPPQPKPKPKTRPGK